MERKVENLDPMNDVLFKYILGSVERKHITIDFLNAVLDRNGKNAIKQIEFPNIEMTPHNEYEKFARIDILAVIDDNERVNIEVQCANHRNMEKRSLYYWAQVFLHDDSWMKSKQYAALKPTIAINVLNYKLLPFDEPYSRYSLRNDNHPQHIMTDAIEFYFLEVPKFVKKPFAEMNHIEKWLGFFSKKLTLKEKEEMVVNEPAMQDALNSMNPFAMSERDYLAYINRQAAILDYNSDMHGARAEGRNEGRVEGIAEGRAEGRVEGIAEGRVEGRNEGEDKMHLLFSELSKAGRFEDISKLCADKSLAKKFYKEFGIEW